MKKVIFTLAVAAMTTGIFIAGCQKTPDKEKAAQDKVENAKEDLTDAYQQAQKTASNEEWQKFKSESEIRIKANEVLIAELKQKIVRSGQTFDAVYSKNIDILEQKNKDLKAKIEAYEKSRSPWESFKREFSHDINELGSALKDLTVDNKK